MGVNEQSCTRFFNATTALEIVHFPGVLQCSLLPSLLSSILNKSKYYIGLVPLSSVFRKGCNILHQRVGFCVEWLHHWLHRLKRNLRTDNYNRSPFYGSNVQKRKLEISGIMAAPFPCPNLSKVWILSIDKYAESANKVGRTISMVKRCFVAVECFSRQRQQPCPRVAHT